MQWNPTKKYHEHDKALREHVKLFKDEYKDQEIKIKGENCKKRAGKTGYSPVRSQAFIVSDRDEDFQGKKN